MDGRLTFLVFGDIRSEKRRFVNFLKDVISICKKATVLKKGAINIIARYQITAVLKER